MKRLFTGMMFGALAATIINKRKSSTKSLMKKGKRAIIKKFDEMLNV